MSSQIFSPKNQHFIITSITGNDVMCLNMLDIIGEMEALFDIQT